jgi:hypothetical protein
MADKYLAFIKKSFKGVKNYEYSVRHAWHTAEYLKSSIRRFGEVSRAEIKNIFLAGLGHDLIEDTAVTASEIKKRWGAVVLKYIKGLTNEKGDGNFGPYIKRLKKSSEEILLVKFADIYSNVFNSVKNYKALDKKWIKIFWLPLLDRYNRELLPLIFLKYPKTAKLMVRQIKVKIEALKNKLKR